MGANEWTFKGGNFSQSTYYGSAGTQSDVMVNSSYDYVFGKNKISKTRICMTGWIGSTSGSVRTMNKGVGIGTPTMGEKGRFILGMYFFSDPTKQANATVARGTAKFPLYTIEYTYTGENMNCLLDVVGNVSVSVYINNNIVDTYNLREQPQIVLNLKTNDVIQMRIVDNYTYDMAFNVSVDKYEPIIDISNTFTNYIPINTKTGNPKLDYIESGDF